MIFHKESTKPEVNDDVEKSQKDFISDMSYRIRNPLNSVYGLSEIILRGMDQGYSEEQIRMYVNILRDSAVKLQEVIDDCFDQFSKQPVVEEKEPEEIKEDDYSVLNNLRVMIVEDNNINQMIVKELMEKEGAKVTLCDNGREAVDLFTQSITGTYDVILMDIKMPEMDGYEATDIIRHSDHAQAKIIPIIAMTAETFTEDIERALMVGMNAHLAKPFGLKKLVSAIKGNI